MNSAKNNAFKSAELLEKVAFGGSIGRAVAKASKEDPFLTLATGVTLGGLAGGMMTGGSKGLTSKPTDTASYKIDRFLNPGVSGALDRIKADEVLAGQLTKNVGEIANSIVNAYVAKLGKGIKKRMVRPHQQKLLQELVTSDEMISQADPDQVSNIFNTMTEIAPKMTKHREAVRSFLRQGLAHEGGIDPVLLGELAKAEARLSGKGLDAR
tara:strand:- start:10967 stop:11599 length:633 start_codon:yes stop_codon:yes gene_type:complete